MGANNVLLKREVGVTILTLNRPDKLNALNKDVFDELKSAIDVIETDPSVRVVILTGAGEKAFCVGADLKERQGMNEKDILVRLEMVRTIYHRFENLAVPTIAVINGAALGGGLELSLCCDIRVASLTATLGFPEVELAIIPGNGGTQRLPRLIGMARAMELIFTAKRLNATEAEKLGIINATSSEPMNTARQMAMRMLEMGPIALRQAKSAMRRGMEMALADGLKLEVECYRACLYSKDRIEGLKAFAEKRKPLYQGV